MAVVMIVGGSA